MENKRFKPLVDKLFWIILIISAPIMIGLTALIFIYPAPISTVLIVAADVFVAYFLISPLFGYVELRESTLFIKFGFIMKREIPYSSIRGTAVARKFYSDSMLSLKNSFEHVNIKYNKFDIMSVSVINNDGFIKQLEERIAANHLFDIEDGMIMKYFGDVGDLVIPEGVRDIFFEVFMYHVKITKVTIPGSIRELTPSTFFGCPALTEATVAEGMETIGFNAFEECASLWRIVLPKSLREIQKSAFAGCKALREICYRGSAEDWSAVTLGEDWDKDTGAYKLIFNYSD